MANETKTQNTKSKTSSGPSTKPRSVIERIRKPSGIIRRVALCIYGQGGVGKTTLLGTMRGKGLVIDVPQVEGGTMVLADQATHVDVAPVVTWKELNELYRFLRHDAHEYRWVGVDTVTACQQLGKRQLLREKDEVAEGARRRMRIQEWGDLADMMGEFFYAFRLLPMHVIFLAQEQLRTDDDGTRLCRPDLSPASLTKLRTCLSLLGRYYVWQNDAGVWERRLRVHINPDFGTKSRSVKGRELPAVILNPRLDNILDYMMGKEGTKKPKAGEDELASGLLLEDDDDLTEG